MLRKLEQRDAAYMLEWMRDDSINCNFQFPFWKMTIEKVETFIRNSFDDENRHFAITGEQDEYLGTISLKHISRKDCNAEYAIVMRKKAQGTGIATQATREIIQYAFEEMGLHKLYLNVLEENQRARALYEKCGFTQEGIAKDAIRIRGNYYNLVWYGLVKETK